MVYLNKIEEQQECFLLFAFRYDYGKQTNKRSGVDLAPTNKCVLEMK